MMLAVKEDQMFSSGNVTVYVTNMDRAVRFYTDVLGLKLAYRFGDHWASVELGKGLTIGLHPTNEQPAPLRRKARSGDRARAFGEDRGRNENTGGPWRTISRAPRRGKGRQVRRIPGSRRQPALSR